MNTSYHEKKQCWKFKIIAPRREDYIEQSMYYDVLKWYQI